MYRYFLAHSPHTGTVQFNAAPLSSISMVTTHLLIVLA